MNLEPHLAALQEMQEKVRLNGNHRYTYMGKYQPGVTTVINVIDKPQLDRWKVRVQVDATARTAYSSRPVENEPLEAYAARLSRLAAEQYEHERLSDEAARVGTDVHALIEHAVKTMLGQKLSPPDACEEALYRFAGWGQWAKDVGLTPLASESRVYNLEHSYCGTLDLLCLIKADGSVTDFKANEKIWPERRLQLAAYRKALESIGFPPLRGYINCLPREGGDIKLIEVDPPGPELEASFQAFLSCLSLYRWQAECERKARRESAA